MKITQPHTLGTRFSIDNVEEKSNSPYVVFS
jgi:hypothetical protein